MVNYYSHDPGLSRNLRACVLPVGLFLCGVVSWKIYDDAIQDDKALTSVVAAC